MILSRHFLRGILAMHNFSLCGSNPMHPTMLVCPRPVHSFQAHWHPQCVPLSSKKKRRRTATKRSRIILLLQKKKLGGFSSVSPSRQSQHVCEFLHWHFAIRTKCTQRCWLIPAWPYPFAGPLASPERTPDHKKKQRDKKKKMKMTVSQLLFQSSVP